MALLGSQAAQHDGQRFGAFKGLGTAFSFFFFFLISFIALLLLFCWRD